MNKINELQNQEKMLKYRFAHKYLYAKAKSKYNISFTLSIVVLMGGMVPYITEKFSAHLAIGATVVTIVGWILNTIDNNKRKIAVDFQEYVDSSLFEFKINKDIIPNLNKLDSIANELVIDNRKEYEQEIDPSNRDGVYNWYADVSTLPLEVARVVCQHENTRWENRQRGQYSKLIVGVIVIVVAGFALKVHIAEEDWINIFCIAPIVSELVKVLAANYKTTKAINSAQELIDDSYLNIEQKKSRYNKKKNMENSQKIQRYINEYRKNNVSVPEALYKKMKEKEQLKSTQFIHMRVREIFEHL